jgi:hypothetical protein
MFVVQNEDGMKAKKTDVVGEFVAQKMDATHAAKLVRVRESCR